MCSVNKKLNSCLSLIKNVLSILKEIQSVTRLKTEEVKYGQLENCNHWFYFSNSIV